jgi:hypothetical protein
MTSNGCALVQEVKSALKALEPVFGDRSQIKSDHGLVSARQVTLETFFFEKLLLADEAFEQLPKTPRKSRVTRKD